MHRKTILTAVALALIVSLPLFASAQTVASSSSSTLAELEAQLQALLMQVASLHQQIMQVQGTSTMPVQAMPIMMNTSSMPMMPPQGMMGTSSMPMMAGSSSPMGGAPKGFCLNLTRNLSIGSRGGDVVQLQQLLGEDPTIYNVSSTGYFGPLTAAAVQKFQTKYGVVSSNFFATSSTGYIGPMTRKFFAAHCPPMPQGTSSMPMMPAGGSAMPMMPPQGMMSTSSMPMMTGPMIPASGSMPMPPPQGPSGYASGTMPPYLQGPNP